MHITEFRVMMSVISVKSQTENNEGVGEEVQRRKHNQYGKSQKQLESAARKSIVI